MGARREAEAADIRMQLQQLPGSANRDCKRPGLIDLLDEVERTILDRMKGDRLEFDLPQHVERIAGLC
ncbi:MULTISPECIES: hypothetical protein [unclassified Mesorhizobium]|uniref:hypothetical protein n=1 Tax=unclassified Mesorhizobium TaxID=325217 RepID=UPI00333BBD01